MICLLNNKIVILSSGKTSWNNIAPILATRNLKVCARHARLKDILLWKYLESFMNMRSLERRWNWDSDTKTTAHGSKSSLQSFVVIVGFRVLKNSLDYLKGLTAKLQRRDIDVLEAYTMIDNIKPEIQHLRDAIGVEFQRWHNEAKQLVLKRKCQGFQEFSIIGPMHTPLLYYKRSIDLAN